MEGQEFDSDSDFCFYRKAVDDIIKKLIMTLIIYAHPGTEGFNSRILARAKQLLDEKGEEYEVIDLYSIGYDPVLKKEEHYTAGNKRITEENLEFQNKIKQASRLLFIYPIWWGGMPAILKGFLERVFTPGFAFKYRKNKLIKSIPDKLLTDKRAVCLITSGGPKIFYALLLNPVKIINRFIIFGFFGARSKTIQIYDARKVTRQREDEINKKVRTGVAWLLK